MSYAQHSPRFFADALNHTLDRYALRHRRGFVTLPANINSRTAHVALDRAEAVPHPCGTEPSPGGTGRSLRSARPANPFKNVCGQIAERDGLVSAGSV